MIVTSAAFEGNPQFAAWLDNIGVERDGHVGRVDLCTRDQAAEISQISLRADWLWKSYESAFPGLQVLTNSHPHDGVHHVSHSVMTPARKD
jgi:hypothetical protein